MPAFWQGITGGLEPGEGFMECARRELFEETGLTGYDLEKTGWTGRIPMKDNWRGMYPPGTEYLEEHGFFAILDDLPEIRLSGEHDRWDLFTAEEAFSLFHFDNNRDSFIKALSRLP